MLFNQNFITGISAKYVFLQKNYAVCQDTKIINNKGKYFPIPQILNSTNGHPGARSAAVG
jgi:hypothetical protein